MIATRTSIPSRVIGRNNARRLQHRHRERVSLKIISGGQTGVDRAALDAALKYGIECGGWCPAGRRDEFGRIPDRYPVNELKKGGFAERTLQNVKDSDGTVVIYFDKLHGGTEYTVECCNELQRPYQLIDAAKISSECAAKLIDRFVSRLRDPRGRARIRCSAPVGSVVDLVHNHKIDILNVAGPRESEWANGCAYAFRALDIFLSRPKRHAPTRS